MYLDNIHATCMSYHVMSCQVMHWNIILWILCCIRQHNTQTHTHIYIIIIYIYNYIYNIVNEICIHNHTYTIIHIIHIATSSNYSWAWEAWPPPRESCHQRSPPGSGSRPWSNEWMVGLDLDGWGLLRDNGWGFPWCSMFFLNSSAKPLINDQWWENHKSKTKSMVQHLPEAMGFYSATGDSCSISCKSVDQRSTKQARDGSL